MDVSAASPAKVVVSVAPASPRYLMIPLTVSGVVFGANGTATMTMVTFPASMNESAEVMIRQYRLYGADGTINAGDSTA